MSSRVKDWLERSMMTSMALDFSSTIWSSAVRSLPGRVEGEVSYSLRPSGHADQGNALIGTPCQVTSMCSGSSPEELAAWVERSRLFLEEEQLKGVTKCQLV